jgi:hypothetical protein
MTHGATRTSRLRRGTAAAALIAACAAGGAGLAGCGSGTVANVVDPVAKAATVSNQTNGMRMTMTMRMTVPGLSTPISAAGQGAFNTSGHSGSLTLAMDFSSIPQVSQVLGTSTLQLQELISGTTIYMKLPSAITSKVAAFRKPWLKIDLARAASAAGIPGLGSLASNPASTDPTQFLRYLRAESGHVTKVGTATVDGRQTTQYRAQIDYDRVPSAFPASARPQVRQAIAALKRLTHIRRLPVNVWIDTHHLVRKMQFVLQETVSGQALNVAMTMHIPQYGPQPTPTIPPASQVQDISGLAGAGASAP